MINREISSQELYECYMDTLHKCGVYLLSSSDETIAYNIYEEFDIGVHSFLNTSSLQRLLSNGHISNEMFEKSKTLYNIVLDLQKTNEWDFENFKDSIKWKEVMNLSDEIKSFV